MKTLAILSLALVAQTVLAARQPLSLHPENPHYFLFRGKPTVIITSGEHYGAVLNLDFDYRKYLHTLQRDGMNNTRTFAGAYCEPTGAFNIASNTLAPLPGRFISPFARSQEPGYANGGNKFDLSQWDAQYFKRLKDFMDHASKRGVIVEVNLFCPFYEESMWRLSPMNAINNVNGVGSVPRTNVYTLDKQGGLLPYQEAMVRKIVTELKDYDNLYYEICNEPYFGGVTLAWQERISQVIAETEKSLRVRHLISQNIANGKAKVTTPNPLVSVLNFHYASPPDTVGMNYDLNKVIGDNETGFRGTNDGVYRMEAWDFLTAGGALYNNLDYSFVAGYEDGTFVYPASQPGGGSPTLRRQLKFLAEVMRGLDFLEMRPEARAFTGDLPKGVTVRALGKGGKEYLCYIRTGIGQKKDGLRLQEAFSEGELKLKVRLPQGVYSGSWLSPSDSKKLGTIQVRQEGEEQVLSVPAFREDVALVLTARGGKRR